MYVLCLVSITYVNQVGVIPIVNMSWLDDGTIVTANPFPLLILFEVSYALICSTLEVIIIVI